MTNFVLSKRMLTSPRTEIVLLGFFLPFYALLISLLHSPNLVGDEGRYLMFATNIVAGYYSPPPPEISLWNGPGYPLSLAPWIALDGSRYVMLLMNALWQAFSVVLLFSLASRFLSKRSSLLISIFWGLWIFSLETMTKLYSEAWSVFLVTLTFFFMVRLEQGHVRDVILSGCAFGLLMLSKVIFSYVGLAMILCCLAFYWVHHKAFYKRAALAFALSFVITVPYLIYTYNLTGKVFYWSNAGGSSLYWMSSPHANEFGDWNSLRLDAYCWDGNPICNMSFYQKNHGKFMQELQLLSPVERDERMKKAAIANIMTSPTTYLKNCYANVMRMFFNSPESYNFPRLSSVARMLPGAVLLTSTLLAFVICGLRFRHLSPEIKVIGFFVFIYLGGSSLLSAYPRMLNIMLPLILLTIAYCFEKLVKFGWSSEK